MDTGVRIAAVAAVVALACAGVAPASAGGPLAHIACSRSATRTCSESGTENLPPDSYGSQSTDTVPDSATSADSYLEPLNDRQLADFDSTWETVVADFPTFGKVRNVVVRRVLTCAVVARAAGDSKKGDFWNEPTQASVTADNFDAAVLSICLSRVVRAQRAPGAGDLPMRGATAGGRCAPFFAAVPVTLQRVGRKYRITTAGPSKRARGGRTLSVSCRFKGNGVVITSRPRRRGARLRSLIGSHLAVGFSNPTPRPVAFRATYTFRAR